MQLTGRAAIITGANRGLGLAIAEAFVRSGASVLLTGRDGTLLGQVVEQLRPLASGGQRVEGMVSDVSAAESCQEVARKAMEALGHLDILVNNAGVYGPKGRIDQVDWAEWVRAIEINLFGTVLMTRAAVPTMVTRRYGKIINLSGGGATAPLPCISAYAASKAAVVRLTETFAEEFRDSNIDVNAIAPGALNTRLLDEVLAAGPGRVGEKFYQRSLKQHNEGGTPLGKGADLAVFLASAASDGITGRLISAVWDDWPNLPSHKAELASGDIYTLRRIVPEDRKTNW